MSNVTDTTREGGTESQAGLPRASASLTSAGDRAHISISPSRSSRRTFAELPDILQRYQVVQRIERIAFNLGHFDANFGPWRPLRYYRSTESRIRMREAMERLMTYAAGLPR